MSWDDYRIFLEISKAGGLKKAAQLLGMHHSSCARRLNKLEENLGVRLFDRLPGGYTPTRSGQELARSMQIIRDEFDGIERGLTGKDLSLEGPVKLSLTHGLALNLLMSDIQSFMNNYQDIMLELNMTYRFSDLASREADVAIRHADDPPLSLAGRRVGQVYWCAYASKTYLEEHCPESAPEKCHWLGWGQPTKHLQWAGKKRFPSVPVRGNFYSDVLQLAALEKHAGIASLPCYLADARPDILRIPGVEPEPREWIWVLAHQDMIGNARVKALIDHLSNAIEKKRPLLMGHPSSDG